MSTGSAPSQRVLRHREKLERRGHKRFEVVVPQADARLVKAIAERLRGGSPQADALRQEAERVLNPSTLKTGADLYALLASAPGLGEIEIERDTNAGRPVAIG